MTWWTRVSVGAFLTAALIWQHAALGRVSVINIKKDGETFRYPMVLVSGTYDGNRLVVETLPRGLEVSTTTLGDKFRFLVDLKPGVNSVRISDGDSAAELKLTYQPPTSTQYRIKAWYVVCKGEKPLSPDFNVHITPLYKEKISTQVKLMQTWSAEDMKRGGYGPRTFYPLFDENGDVDVGLIELPLTREELESKPEVSGHRLAFSQLPEKFKDQGIKNIAFSSVKAAAEGGGIFAYVGCKTLMQIGPSRVRDIMDALHYPVAVDYLTWRAYVGVTLHETGHMLHGAWHPGGANNILQSAYANISRYFTLCDDPRSLAAHNDKDLSSWGVHQPLMNWNRFFMSPDQRDYKDSKVGIAFTDKEIQVTSDHELAVLYYHIPDAACTFSVTVADRHVRQHSLDVQKMVQELKVKGGYTGDWFYVMGVDVQGNANSRIYTVGEWNKVCPHLAMGKPVKATGIRDPEGNMVPEKAVDGILNNDSGWHCGSSPAWLEVDLEKVYSIDRVTVVTYYDGGRYYRYTVEASTEGKTWATVVDMSKNTKPSVKGGQEHAFARTAARYVRVNMLKNSANEGLHLNEIMVFEAK